MFSTIMRSLAHNQRKHTRLQDACKVCPPKYVLAIQKMFQSNDSKSKISAFDFGGAQKNRDAELDVDDFEFEEKILHSEFPMIVNFHADWCEPCMTTTPALKKAIHESEFVCMTTLVPEDHVEVTLQFRVQALPTILAFNQGYLVKKLVGLVTTEEIDDLVIKMDQSYKKRLIMSNKGR